MKLEPELLEQLAASPETEIIGVIDPSGVCGFSSRGDGASTLLFTFAGWRQTGDVFQKSKLTVRMKVPKDEIKIFQEQMSSYDAVRIRAKFSRDNVLGSPQALLIDLIGKDDSDAEMNAYAKELQEPVTFQDSQLGLFTLDRRLNWFEAKPEWGGNSVSLTVPAEDSDKTEKALTVARSLWAAQSDWQRKIAACAVDQLLELKNGAWLNEDEAQLSAQEFSKRMTLESISIHKDDSFEFWFNDGDLFWGHSIMVSGNLEAGPEKAGMHG